jgi:4'-phosphopantetheinyl transferase
MKSSGTAAVKQSKIFNSSWTQPPEELFLENDEAHVWLVSLSADGITGLEQIISEDERARAARFRSPEHKTEYLAARIYLRIILGKYLGISPRLLRFEYNEYGKPSIAGDTKTDLKFNVSHSRGFALFAITLKNEIGVDLELINPLYVNEEIAAKTMTDNEFALFQTLNTDRRIELFYKCWTRKEAYSKAGGQALTINPAQIETLYSSVKENSESESKKAFTKTSDWSFFDFPPLRGFAAAGAIEGIDKTKLKFWKM